jgi:hypothetical protein
MDLNVRYELYSDTKETEERGLTLTCLYIGVWFTSSACMSFHTSDSHSLHLLPVV